MDDESGPLEAQGVTLGNEEARPCEMYRRSLSTCCLEATTMCHAIEHVAAVPSAPHTPSLWSQQEIAHTCRLLCVQQRAPASKCPPQLNPRERADGLRTQWDEACACIRDTPIGGKSIRVAFARDPDDEPSCRVPALRLAESELEGLVPPERPRCFRQGGARQLVNPSETSW